MELTLKVEASGGSESTGYIELDDDDVAELFDEAYDGWCPVCKTESIADGDLICCNCLGNAVEKHLGDGCCRKDEFCG